MQGEGWEAYTDNGREHTGRDVIEWAREAASLGAGEILLTSVDQEGTRKGMDNALIAAVTEAVNIPVVASGGAGSTGHIIDAVQHGADAVALADMLHYERNDLVDIRDAMLLAGISVRRVGTTIGEAA